MTREADTVTAGSSSSPSLEQYINLANYVYTTGETPPPSQFASILGLNPLLKNNGSPYELEHSATGFYGEAFVNSQSSTKQVIIAFQGTNPNPPNIEFGYEQTVVDDGDIQAGKFAPVYKTALNFTKSAIAQAKRLYGNNVQVVLDGHSLGAAEAEYVASKTGLAGVTFGTPGIVPAAGSPASKLQNYVEQGDPVGNYATNTPDYLSNYVEKPSIVHYGKTTLEGPYVHSGVLQAANTAFGEDTTDGDTIGDSLLAGGAYLYHPLGTYATDLGLKIYSGDNTVGSDVPVCYAAGTRIRTPSGDVEIEALAVGDLVETISGALKPIRWLGKRRIDCRRHGFPQLVQPIRIAAHAFGQGRPARDLFVSPAHAICIDGLGEVLIPAASLLNGTTITQQTVDTVTYWHLELERHDIVLADNLPAESYLDCGNRSFFDNGPVVAHTALPDRQIDPHADFCRPYCQAGPLVEAVKAVLLTRGRAARSRSSHAPVSAPITSTVLARQSIAR